MKQMHQKYIKFINSVDLPLPEIKKIIKYKSRQIILLFVYWSSYSLLLVATVFHGLNKSFNLSTILHRVLKWEAENEKHFGVWTTIK